MYHDWNKEDFHPLHTCFFCKQRTAETEETMEIYKVIQNTEGFPGYVVKYTTARILIPICNQCSEQHQKEGNQLWTLWFIVWALSAAIIFYYCLYRPANGYITSLILSMCIALPLSYIPFYVLTVIWGLVSKNTDEVASTEDYPLIRKFKSMGWQLSTPKPKYDGRKNEDIDKDKIQQLNAQYSLEASNTIAEFIIWCESQK